MEEARLVVVEADDFIDTESLEVAIQLIVKWAIRGVQNVDGDERASRLAVDARLH